MGVDSLSFEPSDKLSRPNRSISLSGWSDDTLSFDAKVYIGFVAFVSKYNIGMNNRVEIDSSEMKEIADDLNRWDFQDSKYNPSYQEPVEPDRSDPKNTPDREYRIYGRGPNSLKEVDDLEYLLRKYAKEDGKLVYYY